MIILYIIDHYVNYQLSVFLNAASFLVEQAFWLGSFCQSKNSWPLCLHFEDITCSLILQWHRFIFFLHCFQPAISPFAHPLTCSNASLQENRRMSGNMMLRGRTASSEHLSQKPYWVVTTPPPPCHPIISFLLWYPTASVYLFLSLGKQPCVYIPCLIIVAFLSVNLNELCCLVDHVYSIT